MSNDVTTGESRKMQQRARTRARLVAEARALFATEGFAGAATEEVVRRAGVTRGALYHQFADKAALFGAVFEAVSRDVVVAIERRARAAGSARAALVAGSIAFVEVALDPAIRRIYLIDAPAVLGWAGWRAADANHGVASLRQGVAAVLAGPPARTGDADALTHLLAGALNELALWAAEAPDDRARRHRVRAVIEQAILALFGEDPPPTPTRRRGKQTR
jgi:AcrR family transcriptional regulator